MSTNTPEEHAFQSPLECQYVLSVPAETCDILVIALHGYAMNARSMLELTRMVMGPRTVIASIQGPNQIYLDPTPSSAKIGYHWGTRDHGPANIRLHHAMIREVRQRLEKRFDIPAAKTVLLGFSQPVGYNYRFAATFPEEAGGVIGVCGGVPRDWETGDYGQVKAALLHIARQEDEYFPPDVTLDYQRKLLSRASDVEFHLLAGGHRFPSKGAATIGPWIERVFGAD